MCVCVKLWYLAESSKWERYANEGQGRWDVREESICLGSRISK